MLADVRHDRFAGGVGSLRLGCGQGRWQFRRGPPMQVALIGIGVCRQRFKHLPKAVVKLLHLLRRFQA